MYAIISTGGKQYKVQEGEILKVEKLGAEVGDAVDFTDVLLVGDGDNANIGEPMLQGAKVTGEVVEHGRADKINIVKFKRRKHHLKRMGHRQHYTAVKITKIAA